MANGKETNNRKHEKSAPKTDEARRYRNSRRGNGNTADWSSCDPGLLALVISSVSARGCAVQFGYTRDATSYRIRIVGDGEPFDEYRTPNDDIDAWLQGLASDYGL